MSLHPTDYGHSETDKELEALLRRLEISYREARISLSEKIEKYMDKFEQEDAFKRALYDSGELSHEDYMAWRARKIAGTKQWRDMLDQLSDDMTNQNRIAASMIDDSLPDVYALNHNYGTFEAEKGSGYDTTYTMYDKFTVKRLLTEHDDLLPRPSVDIPKDMLWNKQHIQSAVLQGILTGEPMGDIAKRLMNVADMTQRSAMRNARTAVTGAENAGRIDSYKRADKMGIKMRQQWMATLDGRTRDSHVVLDGETQEVGKKFSNGCRYPGDPSGPGEEVYNCRCTVVAIVAGADPYDPHLRESAYLKEQGLTYEEWKEQHGERAQDEKPVFTMAQGKDISGSWVRRPDKFDFEIEDVINAQGFDGLPRVVSRAEFDEFVKQANGGNGFIAQRTYSASNQETLDLYRDQLYNGKWYVDCSVGGSVHGQGMYCAANYNGIVSNGMKTEMWSYASLGESKFEKPLDRLEINSRRHEHAERAGNLIISNGGSNQQAYAEYQRILNIPDEEYAKEYARDLLGTKGVSFIETFTLSPDANIIDESVLREQFNNLNEQEKSKFTDIGVFAVSKGYDAIRTSEGVDCDVVILNRTKCIILRLEGD